MPELTAAEQMPDTILMNVTLPGSLREFVQAKVAAGEFQSADDVVCEGLKLLQRQQAWKTEARAQIDEGWTQAKSGDLHSPEQTVKILNDRKQAWKSSR